MAVYFKNFSITKPAHLGGGQWILENVSDVSVIFGRNASGKSQLLRALRDQDKEHRHYASPERGGEISFNPGLMQEEFDPNTRASKRQRNLAPTYREEVISRIQTFLSKRGDIRTARIRQNPSEIEKMLHVLLPDFNFNIIGGKNPPYELKRIHTEEIVSSVNTLSSGESEILTLGLDLLTICAIWELEKKKPRVLLVDEPDLHLHPDLQQHLASFLIKLIETYHTQIIIATHSTTLLSALGYHGGEKTSVIYLDNFKEIQKAINFDKTLRELATCLGGHALMGPLFSYPLLLVEGEDDYKVWSQAVRHQKLKLAVIPCNGEEIEQYAATLEKIFTAILDDNKPSAYVIRDSDDSEENPPDKRSEKYVKRLKLSCREIENLYLTNEVLTKMNLTWDVAKNKIIKISGKFGQKNEQLKQIINSERKTTDLKGLMEELTQILDSEKKVDWRIRIGQSLGEQKPIGQLADFLGQGIMTTFWPE